MTLELANISPAAFDAETEANVLAARYAERDGAALLAAIIETEFSGRISLVSSFGAESAVLLHMVATIDRALPVIFIDTGKLFGETLRHRDRLIERLGLSDVRTVHPRPELIAEHDPRGVLWVSDEERCCWARKVEPLDRALNGFDAWITGRKSYQGGARAGLPVIEALDGRVKINPLAKWSRRRIVAYLDEHDLPRHPLEEDGYLSIGCMPCTDRIAPGEGVRAGRWRNSARDECGIHLPITHRAGALKAVD